MVAQGTERLWWTKSYKIMSDRGVSREHLVPIFPNTNRCNEHLKSSSKKFQASKGKIPENAQLPFITQGLSRSWSPKGQTGSKRREFVEEKDVVWNTVMQRSVQQKILEPDSAGSWETPQGKITPGSSWACHGDQEQGQEMRGVDQAWEVPSSILITSWWEFGDCPSEGVLSWVFHRSTDCNSGHCWIRSSDSKGKSWSLFCSKN